VGSVGLGGVGLGGVGLGGVGLGGAGIGGAGTGRGGTGRADVEPGEGARGATPGGGRGTLVRIESGRPGAALPSLASAGPVTGMPSPFKVTGVEPPGTGTLGGTRAGVWGVATAEGSAEGGAGAAGTAGATSGTTVGGACFEATTVLLSGAEPGIAVRAMPPPINATAGSAAQTLSQGTAVVGTRLHSTCRSPWELFGTPPAALASTQLEPRTSAVLADLRGTLVRPATRP
jgi:hypothetical protein